MAPRRGLIELRTAPHQKAVQDVPVIMRNVVYALLPIVAFSIWQYGLSALALVLVVTASCLGTERWLSHLAARANTLADGSAVITGLLLALTLPPGFPLWMGAVAGFIAIALGKALFGGLGGNVFNPALVGRAFAQAAFPAAITSWTPAYFPSRFVEFIPSSLTLPFMRPVDTLGWAQQQVDGFTGATPLARWQFDNVVTPWQDFISGVATASAGETSALLILVCGLYLALRRFMDWRIPVAVLGSAVLLAWGFQLWDAARYPDPLFVLVSGGLMLGAVFMATDMATAPMTPAGVWIYGAVIGGLTVVIRYLGGLTEGVMYAILFANALAPLIDRYTQPRVFGAVKPGKRT
ncbi:MAG: RnfABCDGE type electron transport complex subunit D [Thiotrichales bacterium]